MAGGELPDGGEEEEERDTQEDVNISAEDQCDEPPRDHSGGRESDEHSAEERFVGDRVQVRAGLCGKVEGAGGGAVENVRDGREEKEGEGLCVVAAENGLDNKGRQQESEQREGVREVQPRGHSDLV